jgi:hypothetical protein
VGFGGVSGALGRSRRGEDGGGAKAKRGNRRARGHAGRKGGGGDGGNEGTWAACSLGAVAKAAEAWRGRRKAKWRILAWTRRVAVRAIVRNKRGEEKHGEGEEKGNLACHTRVLMDVESHFLCEKVYEERDYLRECSPRRFDHVFLIASDL